MLAAFREQTKPESLGQVPKNLVARGGMLHATFIMHKALRNGSRYNEPRWLRPMKFSGRLDGRRVSGILTSKLWDSLKPVPFPKVGRIGE
jgi:hypothetical protein